MADPETESKTDTKSAPKAEKKGKTITVVFANGLEREFPARFADTYRRKMLPNKGGIIKVKEVRG